MTDCSQCQHYRPRRSPFRALVENCGMMTSGLGQAFTQIYSKEQRDLEREDQEAAACIHSDKISFRTKPKIYEYCSFRGAIYVTAVKNPARGPECRDTKPRESAPVRRCLDCKHCVRAAGDATAVGVRWLQGYFGIDSNLHDAAAIKGIEFEAAYDTNGVLPWPIPPQFLAYCSKYSEIRGGPYAICALRNQDNQCEGWSPRDVGQQAHANKGGPAYDEILLSSVDDWRWCGNAQYQFNNACLDVKEFDAQSSKWITSQYRLADAPQNVPFTLLDRRRRPREVWVKWRPKNVLIRSGVQPVPGMHELAVYEHHKRVVRLVEGYSQGVQLHRNEDYPYRAWLVCGVLHVEGCGQSHTLRLSRLPKGKWVRPRDSRFGQPLPLRVRRATAATAIDQFIPVTNQDFRSLLNVFGIEGAVELEWLDD